MEVPYGPFAHLLPAGAAIAAGGASWAAGAPAARTDPLATVPGGMDILAVAVVEAHLATGATGLEDTLMSCALEVSKDVHGGQSPEGSWHPASPTTIPRGAGDMITDGLLAAPMAGDSQGRVVNPPSLPRQGGPLGV